MFGIKRKIRYVVNHCISSKMQCKLWYYKYTKEKLNIKNPMSYGEKIQYIKLYGDLENLSNYVDKYEVRNYIREKIGEQYLINLIGVYNNENEIDFENLPNQFVLKCTHGAGYNIICKDKKNININKVKKDLNYCLKEKFYMIAGEIQYKNIRPRIVCEEFLEDTNKELKDYKFFCFSGKPEFVGVDSDRFGMHTRIFYDLNWNKMNLSLDTISFSEMEIKKPKNFEKMIEIAKILSKEFEFVRVDLYNLDGKIYFGELTFTPSSGFTKFNPESEDKRIANLIDLNRIIKK